MTWRITVIMITKMEESGEHDREKSIIMGKRNCKWDSAESFLCLCSQGLSTTTRKLAAGREATGKEGGGKEGVGESEEGETCGQGKVGVNKLS